MRASTVKFGQVINSNDQEPVTQLTAAWPAGVAGPADLSLALQSLQPSRDLTTDMPAGTRLVEGYPASSANMVLSGRLTASSDETDNVQALFDPWNTSSVLYLQDWTGTAGVVFTIKQGLQLVGAAAPEMFTIFSGTVDNCAINRRTGEVTFSLLDDRTDLTLTPQVPAAIAVTPWNTSLTPNPLLAPGLTAIWPLDYILRSNGIYSGPPPLPGCIGYQSMHGSLWPEISGTMSYDRTVLYGTWPANSTAQPLIPIWGAGKFAGQVPNQSYSMYTVTSPVSMFGGTNLMMEGWIKNTSGSSGDSWNFQLQNHTGTNSQVTLLLSQDLTGTITGSVGTQRNNGVNYTSALSTPVSALGWHRVAWLCTFPDNLTVNWTVWIDSVVNAGTITCTAGDEATNTADTAIVTTSTGSGGTTGTLIDTVQWALGPTSPAATFTPTAVLDASLNNLTAVPPIDKGLDAWNIVQQIVDAEGGIAGFDEDGATFRFKNRNNFATTTTQAVVTSLTQITELQFETNEANRARTVSANAFPLLIGQPQVVWQATNTYVIPGHGSITVFANLANPTVFVPYAFSYIPAGGITDFTYNGYRVAYAADGSGTKPSLIRIVANSITSTTVKLTLSNPNGKAVYIVSRKGDGPAASDGQPALSLVGTPILPTGSLDATQVATGAQLIQSVRGNGFPNLTLPDNPFRQDLAATQKFTDDTADDLWLPRPMLTGLTIVGDPRLQLGDRVTISDRGTYIDGGFGPGASIADDAVITAIHAQIDKTNGFTQQLVARFISFPNAWLLGIGGRSELGTTTWV